MTLLDIKAILPLVVIATMTIILVLQLSIRRQHAVSLVLSLFGLLAALWSLRQSSAIAPYNLGSLLLIDSYALIFSGLIIAVAVLVCVMMYTYLLRRDEHREEIYPLILLATLGSIVLTMAGNFVTLILGLETLTIALYVMIGYLRSEHSSLEAGVKDLILAAASSAFLLFGMALIYAELGSMQFQVLALSLNANIDYRQLFVLAGTALVIVGAGFKLGVVPFHMWTPDVYQGAPAPVTAFIATVSKTAMVALLLRYMTQFGLTSNPTILFILGLIAVTSMIAGNILALMQSNLKRLLAYSSIAHLGYVLVAIIVGGSLATEATVFYMIAYSFTTLGAFGLIGYISNGEYEITDLDAYRGLFWRRPAVASVLSVMVLSLAGIPLTAGFIGKFYLLDTGVSAEYWTLVIVLVIASTIGLYYYLRVIAAMLATDESTAQAGSLEQITAVGTAVLTFITAVVIYLGILPAGLQAMIHRLIFDFFTV